MTDTPTTYDYTVIGGGIVGLATALHLKLREPQQSVLLIEKEVRLGRHQTGHNSGVIHAGVYYAPGSLKADFCKRGSAATIEFCRRHHIPYRLCGKLLVATNALEHQRMLDLRTRCEQHRLDVELLDPSQLQRLEPRVTGVAALRVADSGIVDYQRVAEELARQFQMRGGEIQTGCELVAASEHSAGVTLQCAHRRIETAIAVGCAGLMADRVCDLFGIARDFAIVPFRGEYYQLPAAKQRWVEHLIYPIPDPAMPFLGVHLTPMIDGRLTVGPNAVLGWQREGYRRFGNVSVKDSADLLRFPGFWQLARRYRRAGLAELAGSCLKPLYLRRVRKYCPDLRLADLRPYPAGIRAQAVSREGELIHDFLFAQSRRSLHVCNAPSPAATSAMPIGDHVARLAVARRSAL